MRDYWNADWICDEKDNNKIQCKGGLQLLGVSLSVQISATESCIDGSPMLWQMRRLLKDEDDSN